MSPSRAQPLAGGLDNSSCFSRAKSKWDHSRLTKNMTTPFFPSIFSGFSLYSLSEPQWPSTGCPGRAVIWAQGPLEKELGPTFEDTGTKAQEDRSCSGLEREIIFFGVGTVVCNYFRITLFLIREKGIEFTFIFFKPTH